MLKTWGDELLLLLLLLEQVFAALRRYGSGG